MRRVGASPGYLAMRAYQRARLARARLRGPGHRWSGVRILGYHRISDEPDVLSVHPDRFRAQVEQVVASGAVPVSLDDALDRLDRGDEERAVVVTFDDGYLDNLEAAAPVLREHGVPATIFLPTAIIDGEERFHWYEDPPPALGWGHVRALEAEGLIGFGAHTRTHPRLPHVDDERACEEIAGSKRELEERLGRPVTTFCYPAGLYGERDARLVREAGYRAGVTCDPGVNDAETPRETLRRTLVYWEDADADFALKLAGHLDRPPVLRDWLYRRLSRRPEAA